MTREQTVAGPQFERVALYVDPASHHMLGDRLFDDIGQPFLGDEVNAPFVLLREMLNRQGIDVHTADRIPDKEDLRELKVYVSLGRLSDYRRLSRRRDTVLAALFVMECPIVEPSIYRRLADASRYFQSVFSWGDPEALERFIGSRLPLQRFRIPQAFDDVHEEIWKRQDRDFLVMMNANKKPRLYDNELYSERMKAVASFSRSSSIHLYGKGWDRPGVRVGKSPIPATARRLIEGVSSAWNRIHPDPLLVAASSVYKGVASNKAQTIGRYRFALCFENAIIPGWITEKLFDCFFAGTVPVYWGDPDIQNHVPPDCYLDMRDYEDYEELRVALELLSEPEVRDYRESARAFLRSSEFDPFRKSTFAERLCAIVSEAAQPTLLAGAVETPRP